MFFKTQQELDNASFDASSFPKGWDKDGHDYFIPAELRAFYGSREPSHDEFIAGQNSVRFDLYCKDNPEFRAQYEKESTFWSRSPGSAALEAIHERLSRWESREIGSKEEIALVVHAAALEAARNDLNDAKLAVENVKESTCIVCGEFPAHLLDDRTLLDGIPGARSLRSCAPCFVVVEDAYRASFGQQELETGVSRATAAAVFLKDH